MTSSSSSGKAVQIITIDEEKHTVALDEEALSDILNDEGIRDKPVCVVSVAGSFRHGKSFLLDFLLRYLTYHEKNKEAQRVGEEDWMGAQDVPLTGFHWRPGSERDTTGILMWSKAFVVKTPQEGGQEVAVVLMDTQGSFDSSSTIRENASIFALSAMLSSVVVYNLSRDIMEYDLQHLETFSNYACLAMDDEEEEDGERRPLQELLFLIRDWSHPDETKYGAAGGQELVDRRLGVREQQHRELREVRTYIRSCFSHIRGFLMPHPGAKVASNSKFEGCLRDIDPEFLQHLSDLVPTLLAPESIVVKRIRGGGGGGGGLRCQDLVQYFRAYVETFEGDELPEPETLRAANARAENLVALFRAKSGYQERMEGVCGGERPHVPEDVLDGEHLWMKKLSLNDFTMRRKMGGKEFSQRYREQLEEEIEMCYLYFRRYNEGKKSVAWGKPLKSVFSNAGKILLKNVSNLVVITGFAVIAVVVSPAGSLALGVSIGIGTAVCTRAVVECFKYVVNRYVE